MSVAGNESVPKINKLIFLTVISILLISNPNSFRVLFDTFALETASSGSQHCASCIGTLSFLTDVKTILRF